MAISYKKLWVRLAERQMKKQDLQNLTVPKISSATMAKLSNGENVNTEVLVRICKALKCNIADIMEIESE